MSDISDMAKVVSVSPSLIEIEITSPRDYKDLDNQLQIGSYLQISDGTGSLSQLIAVVQGYRVKDAINNDAGEQESSPRFVLSLQPVGRIEGEAFLRGGQHIAIPPKVVEVASDGLLHRIYGPRDRVAALSFGVLSQDPKVTVSLDGDLFFGKHIGVVGNSGSGKSSTVAAILQEGMRPSDHQRTNGVLNNSHIIILDLHGEYPSAFPDARVLDVRDLNLPYWMMSSDELQEMFIESSETNSHNQISQFRDAVTKNKQKWNPDVPPERIAFDSPIYFSLDEVYNYIYNLNVEIIGKLENEGKPKLNDGTLIGNRAEEYFERKLTFANASTSASAKATNGPFYGEFNRFLMRLESRRNDPRLNFLLNPVARDGRTLKTEDSRQVLEAIMGYGENPSNVTIIDLSGIPFEVLSVVVAQVSRLVFTFAMHYKKVREKGASEVPYMLVLEEAHNYVSKAEGVKYRSVRSAIERIAKEGRKYGVSLMVVSQRPSEISETIFSQCGNFVVMRLSNPVDQGYVRRILPDDLAALTGSLSGLERREALLIGDAVTLPSIIRTKFIENLPDSNDVRVHSEWQKDWHRDALDGVIEDWRA